MKSVKINLGSISKPKLAAVKDAFEKYFNTDLKGFPVQSDVSHQPMGLSEIMQGAKTRALKAFKERDCQFSIGIEAGLIPIEGTNTGYMDLAFCVIYDGQKFTYGGTPLFELPKKVIHKVLNEKKEIGFIFPELWPHLPDPGKDNKEAIRFLTRDVVRRNALLEMSVLMALMPIVSKDDFYDF
jgi:inosine/xanthosine triphosphatase